MITLGVQNSRKLVEGAELLRLVVMFTLLLEILSVGESITQTALCGLGFESECAQALGGSVALGLLLTSMTEVTTYMLRR